jgi:hypothetical protein
LVEPFLEDPGTILTACRRKETYSDKVLGKIQLEGAFERKVSPPGAFLRFLIDHSTDLRGAWERKRQEEMSEKTRRLRKLLIEDGDKRTRRRALLELDAVGSKGSERVWWAFEGFTEVDCLIETEKLVLFIEGKRTESLSGATEWFPQRNQIARNLECARQYTAESGKHYAVLVMAEEGTDHSIELSPERIKEGFPHLSEEERTELCDHFLGAIHWQQLRGPWNLGNEHFPDTTEEAVRSGHAR